MTTPHFINKETIISFFLRSRCFRSIRAKYKLNYNCIVVLMGCYIYTITIDQYFLKTPLCRFVGYYSLHLFSKYIVILVECNLLTSTGRKYSLTEDGYSAIAEISDNNDNILYSFCSKYGIEL